MKRTWLWIGLVVLVLLSFVLSESLWNTIGRKSSLRKMEKEMERVSQESNDMREKISNLENDPKNYEQLVRQELSYMRPGEKEIRFLKDKKK